MKANDIAELSLEDLKDMMEDAANELKFRESDAQLDDEGFETMQTIVYLCGKYQQILEKRDAS